MPPPKSSKRSVDEQFSARHFVEVVGKLRGEMARWGGDGARHRVMMTHARQHDAEESQAAVQEAGWRLLDGFPPQGQDINIMTDVWALLGARLGAMGGPYPRTADGWRRRVERAWEEIDQRTIDGLVASVKSLMGAIVEREGAWLPGHRP